MSDDDDDWEEEELDDWEEGRWLGLKFIDIDRFNKHLNCTFDLREVIKCGQLAYDDEQMGQLSALERVVFAPSQLTSFGEFVALMLMLGIAVGHDELLAEALDVLHSMDRDSGCVWLEFAGWRDTELLEAIDPREREEPFTSAAEFMPVLDSLAPFQHDFMSPFAIACRFGRVDLVKQWMCDGEKLTVGLAQAALHDHVDVVVAILQCVGANDQVWNLMHVAAEANATRVIDYLLSRVAEDNTDVADHVETVLAAVIRNCTVDIAARVLDAMEVADALDDRAADSALLFATTSNMAAMLFARFQFEIGTIGRVLKTAFWNEELFDFLFDRFVAWSGDAGEFDSALASAISGLVDARPASFKYLPRLLNLQLRAPNARQFYVFFDIRGGVDADLAALLLGDDRITITWSASFERFSRKICRLLVNLLEHRRFVRQESELLVVINEMPGSSDNRGRVARMYLTDICIALRPMRLPSLVLDEIVSHLPAMSALSAQERMSGTIVKINERQ